MFIKLFFSFIFFSILSQPLFAESLSVILNVKFQIGSVEFNPDGLSAVNNLYTVAKKFPQSKTYIVGHCDSTGNYEKNMELSEARANYIERKLVANGMSSDNLYSKGLGATAPIGDNDTAEGRAKNRRVIATFTGLSPEGISSLKEELSSMDGLSIVKEVSEVEAKYIEQESLGEVSSGEQSEQENMGGSEALVAATAVTGVVAAKTKNRYYGSLGVYNNIVIASDTGSSGEAEWVSEMNIDLGGAVQWSINKFWLGAKLDVHMQNYKIEESSKYTWDEETPILIRGSIISDYELQRLGFGLDLDFNQESFIYETGFNVTLETALMVGATGRLNYKWLDHNDWSSRLGLALSLPIVGSGDLEPKGKLQYIGSLDFKKDKLIGDHGLRLKVYYGQRDFENNQNDQGEEVAGLQLSIDSDNWL